MPSQLGQDKWVLSLFPEPGFFLDVGMFHAIHLSNTYLLEQAGWTGIGIDPFPVKTECRPNTIVKRCAVFSHESDHEFIQASALSCIPEFATQRHWETIKNKPRIIVHATTLAAILEECCAPKFIEYMSLDTEGTEYEILSTFPFDCYTFGCITVEHNHKYPEREQIYDLLVANGYVRAEKVKFDDWYIHRPE